MNQNPNHSIACSVETCAHHCGQQSYCSLNEIKVGCCGTTPANCEATECASFKLGSGGSCCN